MSFIKLYDRAVLMGFKSIFCHVHLAESYVDTSSRFSYQELPGFFHSAWISGCLHQCIWSRVSAIFVCMLFEIR